VQKKAVATKNEPSQQLVGRVFESFGINDNSHLNRTIRNSTSREKSRKSKYRPSNYKIKNVVNVQYHLDRLLSGEKKPKVENEPEIYDRNSCEDRVTQKSEANYSDNRI
jgi:hypothetical protein